MNSTHDLIRNRSRRLQYLALRELRQASGRMRRKEGLQRLMIFVLYFPLFFFGMEMLKPRTGLWGTIAILTAAMLLIQELLWRFYMVPTMERELERLTTLREDNHEAHP